jgi:hypothetical protein
MRIQKEKFILLIFLISSILFGTYLWDLIILPYSDPEIFGFYSLAKHNAANDILRYILFISLPIFTYLIYKFFYQKKFFYLDASTINQPQLSSKIYLFIVILFITFEFLSLEFPIHKIDSFHEGQKLSSAYKSLLDDSLWSGSYVTVGIFYETLSSKLVWKFFNHESIGLVRIVEIFYIYLLKLLLVLLSFLITVFLKFEKFYKSIFFLFNSIIFLTLIDYNIASANLITFREIPIIILTILFGYFLMTKRFQNTVLVIIGSLSLFSMLWGVDRGLVLNLLLICILIYFVFTKQYQSINILILSIMTNWILFYFIVGNEFYHFLDNTISIYQEMNYVHGIIHPTPFSEDPNSYRATKTLISIVICLLISLGLFFKSNKKFPTSFKIFLLFLALISFGSYVYVLGRSDGPHIKHIFGYPVIFFSIYLSYLLIYEFKKKKFNISKIYNNFFLFLGIIFFLFYNLEINFNSIKNYKDRFKAYIYLKDSYFLNKQELIFINKTKEVVKKYDCIQLITNDAAFVYLLKKKNCTKFYFIWSATSLNKQKELLKNLKKNKVIIANGPKDNWDLPLSRKLYLVKGFIKQNYSKYKTIEEWDIYIKN